MIAAMLKTLKRNRERRSREAVRALRAYYQAIDARQQAPLRAKFGILDDVEALDMRIVDAEIRLDREIGR